MAVTEECLGPGQPSLESGEELRHGHREAGQGKVWDSEKKILKSLMNMKQERTYEAATDVNMFLAEQ